MRRPPHTPNGLANYGELLNPKEATEPILASPVRGALMEWLTEIWAAEELKEVGLAPRQRALFHGGPGTGKTTLAHHLAARLGLPMVAIRPDRIIDCWLGSTGRNLGALFDAARPEPNGEGPVVLFFDEFEALGGARKNSDSTGGAQEERNTSIDILLQRIEAHNGYIIAATNHAGWIDPAIWRRFDLHIELDLPGQDERMRILARYLAPYGLPKSVLADLAFACETATPALLRQFCEGLKRNLVIGERLGWDMSRAATFGRIVAAVAPHPDMGKPRIWSHGSDDAAIKSIPWPLPLAKDVIAEDAKDEPPAESTNDSVVHFPPRKPPAPTQPNNGETA